jgi:hypothetical protein
MKDFFLLFPELSLLLLNSSICFHLFFVQAFLKYPFAGRTETVNR